MANEENLKPITNSEMARTLQEKSVEKRKENNIKKAVFRDCIEKKLGKSIDSMIEAMITQSNKGNVQAITFLRDTVGEKPIEKVEGSLTYENSLKEVGGDEY